MGPIPARTFLKVVHGRFQSTVKKMHFFSYRRTYLIMLADKFEKACGAGFLGADHQKLRQKAPPGRPHSETQPHALRRPAGGFVGAGRQR